MAKDKAAIVPVIVEGRVEMLTPTDAEALQRQGKLVLAEDKILLAACVESGKWAFGQRWDQSVDEKKPLAAQHMAFCRLKKSSIIDALKLSEEPLPPPDKERVKLVGGLITKRPFWAGRKQFWRGWKAFLAPADAWRTLSSGQTAFPSELSDLEALRNQTFLQAGQGQKDEQQYFRAVISMMDREIEGRKAKALGLR